ncbi:MAG TPA: hypothetical protein VI981_01370 [Candidatus Paceibacterota bacterium]
MKKQQNGTWALVAPKGTSLHTTKDHADILLIKVGRKSATGEPVPRSVLEEWGMDGDGVEWRITVKYSNTVSDLLDALERLGQLSRGHGDLMETVKVFAIESTETRK